jgi:uncharacterized protein (TIGR02246 family)
VQKGDTVNQDNEQAIFEALEAFATAWSSGDAHLAASFFTDDCVRVGAFGDVQQGRTEIEAAYERLFRQGMPGATIKQARGSVRMLTPEYAVWQGGIEIFSSDGTPTWKGYVVQVMQRVSGRWLTLEAHPKFYPQR